MNARSQLERSVSRFFEAFVKGARCFLALEKGGAAVWIRRDRPLQ